MADLDPVAALTSAALQHAGIVAVIAEHLERDRQHRELSRLARDASVVDGS